MIHEYIELHNVTEVEERSSAGGIMIYRFPRHVRHALGERGRFISEEASGAEIRFVTNSRIVRVALTAPETDGIATVYKGGFFHSQHRLQAGVRQTLQLEEPSRFAEIDRHHLLQSGFAPEVWRICLGRHTCAFGGVNAFGHEIRPPKPGETPAWNWLAYGSSITHGLSNNQLSYIHQAASRLQANVYNLGMSGSCACEKEIADFISERQDWDIATLELGVNMRDHFTPFEFQARTEYLVHNLIDKHPDKPVVLITIFPNFATYPLTETRASENDKRFNEILREHLRNLNHPLLYLIEGDTILRDFANLSCDLIHPGEFGNTMMAENLANQLSAIIGIRKGKYA